MADKKISQLSSATTPLTGTEQLAIVQGGSTVKATAQDIADLGGGGDPKFDLQSLYESGAVFGFTGTNELISIVSASNVVINMIGLGDPSRFRGISLGSKSIIQVKNASLLTNLEDVGTLNCLGLTSNSMSASEINSLFTQLPVTTKVATINVRLNPGSATCNPTIATAKGYIVVTT